MDTQQSPPRSKRGLWMAAIAVLVFLAVMWWGTSGGKRRGAGSDEAIVATCVAEQQRCSLGGTKVGLCGMLPDGALHCIDQH